MLSKRLKELRAIKDITQADLARLLGVTQQAVAKWENEKAEPDNDTLIKLADYFHVSTDYILGRKSTSDNKPSPIKKMLDLYHHLTPEKKKQARSYIAFLAQDNNMV